MVEGDDCTGGVGVILKEGLALKVLEARWKSVTVIVVEMMTGKVTVSLVSRYAMQQNRKEEDIKFYDDACGEIG